MTDRRLAVLVALMAVLAVVFAFDRGWLRGWEENDSAVSSSENALSLESIPIADRATAPGNAGPVRDEKAATATELSGVGLGPASSINPIAQLSLAQLSATRSRPVFEKSRRPPEAKVVFKARPQEPEPPPPPQGPPSLRLIGLAASQDQWVAVITRIGENAPVRLKEGETIDGWRLEVVSSTGVVVSKNGVDHPLILFSR